jgi:capsular exopolysaccharide synthesis family protein
MDDTLKTPEKVHEMLGVPIIGKISEAHRAHPDRSKSSYPAREDPELMNAFGSLRINLNRMMSQKSVKSLLISSPARGDGKTTVAVNLAVAFARSGKKVVLIDGDLYRPQMHVRLKVNNQAGLTSILADGFDWKQVKQTARGLTLITGGPASSSSALLVESDAMTELLDDLQMNFDVVIVDGPPLFIMDAQILASRVGGIIMVIRQGDTLTAVARSMLDQLNLMDVTIFGAVLNCVPQKQSYYFDERIENMGKMPAEMARHPKTGADKKGGSLNEPDKLNETGSPLQ